MEAPQKHIYQELQEELLVKVAYTVVNPRAVVIHSSNATLTNGAVMTQRCFDCRTLFTFLAQDNLQLSNALWTHGFCIRILLGYRLHLSIIFFVFIGASNICFFRHQGQSWTVTSGCSFLIVSLLWESVIEARYLLKYRSINIKLVDSSIKLILYFFLMVFFKLLFALFIEVFALLQLHHQEFFNV